MVTIISMVIFQYSDIHDPTFQTQIKNTKYTTYLKSILYGVVHQGSLNNRKVLYSAFRTFELVAAIQIYIQDWPIFEDISHDIYQKTQQNKTPNRTLTETIS